MEENYEGLLGYQRHQARCIEKIQKAASILFLKIKQLQQKIPMLHLLMTLEQPIEKHFEYHKILVGYIEKAPEVQSTLSLIIEQLQQKILQLQKAQTMSMEFLNQFQQDLEIYQVLKYNQKQLQYPEQKLRLPMRDG
jgi:hypothetical protein